MTSSFARYLSLALLAFAMLLPYAVTNHTYPIPTFYSEFTALALYLVVGAGAAWVAANAWPRPAFATPTVALAPLGFGLVLVVQTLALPLAQPSMNWLGAGFLLAGFMATHAGYAFARANMAEQALRWVAWALVIGGLFAVFCQVVQVLHAEARVAPFVVAYNVMVDRRPFGNMAQANHLATVIAFALAAAMFLVQTRRLNVVLWAVVSAICVLGQALTVSRGPWLQTGVIVVAGFWMAIAVARSERGARGVRDWLIPPLLVAIFVVVNIGVRWANDRYQLNLDVSAAHRFQDKGQFVLRLAMWKYGWTMFRGHPWLGVGWGEFPRYQFELVKMLGDVEVANNSHDIFIDLLAKTGIVGLGVLLIALLSWLIRVLLAPHTAWRVFGLALIGVLLMHALVEYPQQYMFFLLPAMFVFGILETKPLGFVPPRVSLGLHIAIVAGGLLALTPIYREYARAEVLYYGAHPAEQYQAAPSRLFGAWGEYGMATLQPIDSDNLPAKLAMHERAIALLPGETVLRRYAVLQALDGKQADALDTVERLKIFAGVLRDWPVQLSALYELCDDEPKLAAFKAELVKRYGVPPDTEGDGEDDE
ncbi:Wzy polymerase domain-containing protein [Trinickia caryophylli]|uniref:O-antigen ligase n=1 Tax=Trinickia caryophylli TaxID=28094 RepID=A0A1X7EVD3_TRICW|nr:Wzy polymerase domain-containing protein [Trinickia caryophylli]PMS09717.1 polymerase [Trinickia caryophylli]TRX18487.1 polymerase [Trinickia caryophylli]WQE10724.1 Wzy polymerase domain-containing protein [Trinickia caryophylli]SMF40963.1 O-antigen ligase [Trinickia caryophylli]GLU33099.1 polymerase [Trinickia caryophylli]